MSNLSSDKQKMREEFKRRRKAFVTQLDTVTRNLVFRRLPSPLMQKINDGDAIALYNSIGSEAPTLKLAEFLLELSYNLSFPVVYNDNIIKFHEVQTLDLLETGFQNIPEPPKDSPIITPRVIIAPLVAFDRSMGRLGQGGGYYDRAFATYPDALKIGLAWSVQEAQRVPVGRHDVKLDMVVTETEIIQMDSMAS